MPLGPVRCDRCPAVVMGNAAMREHQIAMHVVHGLNCQNYPGGYIAPCACPLRPESQVGA